MSAFGKKSHKLLIPGVFLQSKLTATECKYVTNCINIVSSNTVKKKFHKKNKRRKFHLKQKSLIYYW